MNHVGHADKMFYSVVEENIMKRVFGQKMDINQIGKKEEEGK